MARMIRRGDIWMYQFRKPDKRRPVVVMSRDEAIPFLHSVMVAPITSTVRGLDSEVPVGVQEGLKHGSAINLDFVQTVEKARLRKYVGTVPKRKWMSLCRGLEFAIGCRDEP